MIHAWEGVDCRASAPGRWASVMASLSACPATPGLYQGPQLRGSLLREAGMCLSLDVFPSFQAPAISYMLWMAYNLWYQLYHRQNLFVYIKWQSRSIQASNLPFKIKVPGSQHSEAIPMVPLKWMDGHPLFIASERRAQLEDLGS